MPYQKLAAVLFVFGGLTWSGAKAQENTVPSQLTQGRLGAVGVSCSSKDGEVDCFCTGGCKRTAHDCTCTGIQASTISNDVLRELLKRK